jgi:hypothetical protein
VWFDWVGSLGEFTAIVHELRLEPYGVTPTSLAYLLELEGAPAKVVQALGVVAGIALVVFAFRRQDLLLRLGGLSLGCLLCTPYAMRYELAAFAPVAVAGLLSRTPWGVLVAAPLLGSGAMITTPFAAPGLAVWRGQAAGGGAGSGVSAGGSP